MNQIEFWGNTKKIIKSNLNKVKPCEKLGYCPYGGMVEAFPLLDRNKLSCPIFGHNCPMYYNAEELEVEK